MKCPGRRREDHEPLWHISTRCVLMKWNCLLLRLFWMGTEDLRAYFVFRVNGVMRYVMLPKLKLLLILLLLLCPLPEANNFFIY